MSNTRNRHSAFDIKRTRYNSPVPQSTVCGTKHNVTSQASFSRIYTTENTHTSCLARFKIGARSLSKMSNIYGTVRLVRMVSLVRTVGTVRLVRLVRLVRYAWYGWCAWYGTVGTVGTWWFLSTCASYAYLYGLILLMLTYGLLIL